MGRPSKAAKRRRQTQGKRPNGRLTALILAFLLFGLSVQLWNLFQELGDARAEEISYTARLAELQETNRRLADDIANREDITLIEGIARDELGMASPGEKIFRFSK